LFLATQCVRLLLTLKRYPAERLLN
jgi:hypothetical protein